MKKYLTYIFCFFSVLVFFSHESNTYAQATGSVITYTGSIVYDEEEGRLLFPAFVLIDQPRDELYVVDGKGRVIVYTSDFFPLYTLSKKNGIHTPQGLTVDSNGKLYVAQSGTSASVRNRISIYRACFKWERDIYLTGFEGADSFVPYRLAVDKNGDIYVAASYFPGVVILDAKGVFKEILSPEEDGRKMNIASVTIDSIGRIYLVSEEKGRIYVYDENKEFLFMFGEKGGSSGKLSRPKAVSVDNKSGRMYVVDYMRHAVSVYDREGAYLFEFGGLGWGEGWFQFPIDITVDETGRIFVADLFNQRVQVFNSW